MCVDGFYISGYEKYRRDYRKISTQLSIRLLLLERLPDFFILCIVISYSTLMVVEFTKIYIQFIVSSGRKNSVVPQ